MDDKKILGFTKEEIEEMRINEFEKIKEENHLSVEEMAKKQSKQELRIDLDNK